MSSKSFDEEQQMEERPYYEDKTLRCKDCGQDFILEGGEQAFLHRLEEQGKTDQNGNPVVYREPKRCRDCRAARKMQHS